MSTMSEFEHPELLGAYVLGALDVPERADVESHLAGCSVCRREVEQLSLVRQSLDAVPGHLVLDDLALADPILRDILRAGDDPADDLVLQRTLHQLRAEPSGVRGVRAARWLAVAAGVAAIAGLAGISGVVVGRVTAPVPSAVAPVGGRLVHATDAVTGVSMTATITPAKGWTRLTVSVQGAPAGTCRLMAIGADGTREVAGSWVVGAPVPGKPSVKVDAAVAIPAAGLARLELVNGSGSHLVTVAV